MTHNAPPSPRSAAPSLPNSTLLFAALTAISCVGLPLAFMPLVAGEWAWAVRQRSLPRGATAERPNTTAAGLAVMLVCHVPIVPLLYAWLAVGRDHPHASIDVVGALGFSALATAVFLRLPLLLVEGTPDGAARPLLGAVLLSARHAVSSPRETAICTAVHLGATVLPLALGFAVESLHGRTPVLFLAIPAVMALCWTGSFVLTSRMTPAEAPAANRRSIALLAAILVPPLGAIVLGGGLATRDSRDLTVLHADPMRLERADVPVVGVRGRLDADGFRVRGLLRGARIEPVSGEPYDVSSRYGADITLMSAGECGLLSRLRASDCVRVTMNGSNVSLAIELDGQGRRIDDGLIDRALDRIGRSGTTAIVASALAISLSWFLLARVVRTARRISGGGYRHRLRGRLLLGPDGWLRTDGRLAGHENRVTLLEGGATLRLPEDLVPLAVAPDRREDVDQADVIVATDAPPALTTHRTAESAWPRDAQLVVGEPAKIETEALASAETQIVRAVLVGVTASLAALGVLSFA